MNRQFYVSHNGKIIGSYSPQDIIRKIKAGDFEITDYLYDEEKADWVLLADYPLMQTLLEKENFHAQARTHADPILELGQIEPGEWFILRGENQTGPFPYPDILRMLQEKMVFEYDYVWKPGMESWKRIAEITDFSADTIRRMKETGAGMLKNVFFRRRFKRKSWGGTLIIHDNKKVWHGHGMEVSEGGAGIIMQNAMILPGHTLYLHFRPNAQVPAFNALVEVVSKKYVQGASTPEAPINYGVRFLKIQEEVRKSLRTFVGESKQVA
ncbi:MAG: GYF domain-containing protein [Bdellovibrionales bacterium]